MFYIRFCVARDYIIAINIVFVVHFFMPLFKGYPIWRGLVLYNVYSKCSFVFTLHGVNHLLYLIYSSDKIVCLTFVRCNRLYRRSFV